MRIKFIQNLINKIHRLTPEFLPELKHEYVEPKSTYDKLICVTGFLYSGSGAVLDLLKEYDNVTTLAYSDAESGGKTGGVEMSFFSDFGGILDLEQAFGYYRPYTQDLRLKQFITVFEANYKLGGIFNDRFIELTWDFINKIVDYKVRAFRYMGIIKEFLKPNLYYKKYKNLTAPFVKDKKNGTFVYFLKNLSVKDFRCLAKEYLTSFFKTIESKEYLVLDQFLSNGDPDFEKFKDYIGDYKCIAVYRDPRDVYVTGFLKDILYMPKSPEAFVNWYRNTVEPYKNAKNDNFLLIRFEDLILHYDCTKAKLQQFLCIDDIHHQYKEKFLDVNISIRNVGLYKNFDNQSAIEYIEQNLREYCYKEGI